MSSILFQAAVLHSQLLTRCLSQDMPSSAQTHHSQTKLLNFYCKPLMTPDLPVFVKHTTTPSTLKGQCYVGFGKWNRLSSPRDFTLHKIPWIDLSMFVANILIPGKQNSLQVSPGLPSLYSVLHTFVRLCFLKHISEHFPSPQTVKAPVKKSL